jgi:hypothetical protein
MDKVQDLKERKQLQADRELDGADLGKPVGYPKQF